MSQGETVQINSSFVVNRESVQDTVTDPGPTLVVTEDNITGYGPGWNIGGNGLNNAAGDISAPNWSVDHFQLTNMTIATRGIKQGQAMNLVSQAIGDTAGIYAYVSSDGGPVAVSDEGVTAASFAADETGGGYFHGTVASPPASPPAADTWTPTLQQAGTTETLTFSSYTISENVLTLNVASGTTPKIGTALLISDPPGSPLTIFNGVTITVDQNAPSATPPTISADFSGTDSSGSYSGTATTIIGAGWTTDGGILLNLTRLVYTGNVTGIYDQYIPSGGPFKLSQMPVTFTGEETPTAPSAWGYVVNPGTGLAIPNPATSMDINSWVTVMVALQGSASAGFSEDQLVTVVGSNYTEQCPVQSVGNISGGMQTIVIGVRYPNQSAYIFQGPLTGYYMSLDANLQFSGMRSTYYAFAYLNGNLIFGAYVGGGVEGHRIFGTADMAASDTQTLSPLRSGFHLYPGAEIVANNSLGYDLKLEPNAVLWQAGDVVENPHPCNFGGNALLARRQQFSPTSRDFPSTSLFVQCSGPGIGQSYLPVGINNESAANQYAGIYDALGRPGPLSAPVMITATGPNAGCLYADTAPLPSQKSLGALIRVANPNAAAPGSGLAYQPFGVLAMPHGDNETASIDFDPNLGVYTAYCGFAAHNLIATRSDTPPSSNPPAPFLCTSGEIWSDGEYLYVGLSGNQVKRVALSSF